MDCHPIARYYLATGDPAVIQVSDVPDRFADRHVVGAWTERAGQWGCVHQVALPLHLGHGSHRVFSPASWPRSGWRSARWPRATTCAVS